jgi:hypothetical protein
MIPAMNRWAIIKRPYGTSRTVAPARVRVSLVAAKLELLDERKLGEDVKL